MLSDHRRLHVMPTSRYEAYFTDDPIMKLLRSLGKTEASQACIIVFAGAATISFCVWSPEHSTYDNDKLVRIMYLYDPHACGYDLRASHFIANLQFSNETSVTAIRPLHWMPAMVTVSTRVSAKTRKYVRLSAVIHVFWFIMAIALRIIRLTTQMRPLKLVLATVFYASVFVIIFDLSMAIVYIAHIQQSLTKGMILRYSGWNLDMEIKNYDDFGGWFPIVASICWMRGVIVLAVNIYWCRVLQLIRRRVKKREEKQRLVLEEHDPIPEPQYENPKNDEVLYFRSGEHEPLKHSYRDMLHF